MKPIIPPFASTLGPGGGRVRAALLAAVMAVSCMLPISAAAAEAPPSGEAALRILSAGGMGIELTSKVTLAQLAALLNVTPSELIAKIEALPGNSAIGLLLSGLLTNPNSTLQDVMDTLTASELNVVPVEELINSLLAPAIANSGELQGVIDTLLADLGGDGQLESLASQLDIPSGALEHPSLAPVTDESLVSTLGTNVGALSSLLSGAGSTALPLSSPSPLVTAPIIGTAGEAVELIGTPGSGGGVTLTTVSSTRGPAGPAGSAGSAGPAGPAAPAAPVVVAAAVTPTVTNAFSILSFKLTKNGLIRETVRVPNAGKLSVSASAKGDVASVAGNARTRTSRRAIKVVPKTVSTAAGTDTITIHPAQVIKRAAHIVVSLTTTYTPVGGTSSSKHSAVTFKGNVPERGGK